MNSLRILCSTAALVSVFFMAACSGDSGGGESDVSGSSGDAGGITKEPMASVNKQERYTPADFLSKVEADPKLQALWNKLQADGYTSIDNAGLTEQSDGVDVLWSESSGASLPLKGILQHCAGDDCVAAIWTFSGDEVVWEDENGGEITPRGIGLPVLLKELEGHSFDNPTHVKRQALDPPAEMPQIDVSKRTFFIVNSFGPLWAEGSLDTSRLEKKAVDSGSFDSVEHEVYARAGDVDYILTHAHPFDAMVWLAQGVREEAKTNAVYNPIGLTVNAGVFGDTLYDRTRIEEMLDVNPLQGPGVLVLAGCETMGDGNGGGEMDKSVPVSLDNKARLLVGFKKCGDARDVLMATELFIDGYLGGKTAGDSLADANAYLSGEKSDLEMVLLPDADPESVFLTDVSKFWDRYTDDGVPGDSFFNSNILIINKCTNPATGEEYQEDEFFATAWSNEIAWEGPFFSGERQNPGNDVDFTIEGALLEIKEGAHFFFVVKGGLKPEVQELVLYGTGEIIGTVVDDEKPQEFEIEFKGQGNASGYKNKEGHQCVMQPPLLKTTTGEPSSFKIPVTWKAQEE